MVNLHIFSIIILFREPQKICANKTPTSNSLFYNKYKLSAKSLSLFACDRQELLSRNYAGSVGKLHVPTNSIEFNTITIPHSQNSVLKIYLPRLTRK